ncbi:MAG: hypothetical protein HOZ81_50385 [Streptomyces sp.]|nr:hypothetical protein [Streptomyces sp.]NUS24383.1 hypothetical protein [Streptomyces sp.]
MTTTTLKPVAHGDHRCYRRGCRRPECTTAAVAQANLDRYLRETGRGNVRPSKRAAAHITRLRDSGMPDSHIVRDARLSQDTFTRICAGRPIRRDTEQRVLAVAMSPTLSANCSRVNAVGTARRLQALAVAGWPERTIAIRLGVGISTVNRIITGKRTTVSRRTRDKVTVLFSEWWARRPEDCGIPAVYVARVQAAASRHGWHSGGAWEYIDDPDEQPWYGVQASRVDAVVEDASELIAEGYSREAIALRLGITWDAVRQAYIRKGEPLPEVAA